MSREIKFRGKRVDNGEWVYGWFSSPDTIAIVSGDDYDDIEIIPESVGQFTGLQDKNGVYIYEGDIVKMGYAEIFTGVIYYRIDRWHCKDINNIDYDNGDYYHGDDIFWETAEVIVNIH